MPAAEAGGALGAARLAWLADLGAGGTADPQDVERVCTQPPVERRFEPDAGERAALVPRHARFRALYAALDPLFG